MTDSQLFRRVITTGVAVIAAEAEGGVRGMTANAFIMTRRYAFGG